MRNSCENIVQKALAWMVLQQTDYNGQFATNVVSKSRTACTNITLIILCIWHLLNVSFHSSFVWGFFLNKHRQNKMIFFSIKNTNVFFTDCWVKKKHPLSDVILSRYHNLGNPDCSFLGWIIHSTQLFLHTHVMSETSCIVLLLNRLKVRYEVVQKLYYQTCQ